MERLSVVSGEKPRVFEDNDDEEMDDVQLIRRQSSNRANWFHTHVLDPKGHAHQSGKDIAAPKEKVWKIGAWNVRGMMEAGKLATIIEHMRREHLDVLFLTETKLKDPTKFRTEGFAVFTARRNREASQRHMKSTQGVRSLFPRGHSPS